MATTYTAREVAEKLGTDPHLLRRFLRTTDRWESPGKGKRYNIPAKTFRSLKAQFLRWEKEHTR